LREPSEGVHVKIRDATRRREVFDVVSGIAGLVGDAAVATFA